MKYFVEQTEKGKVLGEKCKKSKEKKNKIYFLFAFCIPCSLCLNTLPLLYCSSISLLEQISVV